MSDFRSSYRANSRADVADLVAAMMNLSEADKVRAQVAVLQLGLMLPRGALRFLLWLASLRGPGRKAIVFAELHRRDPDAMPALWEQTCTHVLSGKDREDKDSVGGWSQREIDLFLSCLPEIQTPSPGHRAGAEG